MIDVIGRAEKTQEESSGSNLRKATPTLTNGNREISIILLGQHAGVPIHSNDVVAFSGLLIKLYREVRTIETLQLTAIEVKEFLHRLLMRVSFQRMVGVVCGRLFKVLQRMWFANVTVHGECSLAMFSSAW